MQVAQYTTNPNHPNSLQVAKEYSLQVAKEYSLQIAKEYSLQIAKEYSLPVAKNPKPNASPPKKPIQTRYHTVNNPLELLILTP